jgi:hypothetical protein
MNAKQEILKGSVMEVDRRIIRVEAPPEHAGVMAALRRAFRDAAREPSDRDFDDLLRKLN